jgi:hypothetical protein
MPEPDNGLTRAATDQPAAHDAEKNPSKPESRLIDLTPQEPVNIGYAGGVRVPKKST